MIRRRPEDWHTPLQALDPLPQSSLHEWSWPFQHFVDVYDEAEDVIIIVICDCLRESTHLDRHGVVEERLWESLKKRGHPILQVVHIDQVLTKMKTIFFERPQIQNANQRRLFIVDKSPRHNLLENCIKVHFLV